MISARTPLLIALLAAAAAAGGCASDGPERSTLPDRPTVERPDGIVPDEVLDMRSELADRRSDSRDLMDASMVSTTELGTEESGPGVIDFFGNAIDSAISVFSLQAFGVW